VILRTIRKTTRGKPLFLPIWGVSISQISNVYSTMAEEKYTLISIWGVSQGQFPKFSLTMMSELIRSKQFDTFHKDKLQKFSSNNFEILGVQRIFPGGGGSGNGGGGGSVCVCVGGWGGGEVMV
jgi:hypothetical protein